MAEYEIEVDIAHTRYGVAKQPHINYEKHPERAHRQPVTPTQIAGYFEARRDLPLSSPLHPDYRP